MALEWLNPLGGVLSSAITNMGNMQLAKYSYEQQKEMVAQQNEYNSPKSQMERYAEAGLNPNLIYGSGQASAGNQQSLPRYEAPKLESPDFKFGEALQLVLQSKSVDKDLQLKDAQIDTQRALANVYSQDARSKSMTNDLLSVINGFGSSLSPEAKAGIESSRALAKYDLGMRSEMFSQDLNRAKTEYQQLSSQQQRYFNENILPLSLKLKQLEVEGASYENAMKAIDSSLWRDYRQSQIYSSPWKLGVDLLDKTLTPGSPVSNAVNDSPLRRILEDPISFKNGPVGYWLNNGDWSGAKKMGKAFYKWLSGR